MDWLQLWAMFKVIEAVIGIIIGVGYLIYMLVSGRK